MKTFCDRATPCKKCARAGESCERGEGLIPARHRHYRGENKTARAALSPRLLPRPLQLPFKRHKVKEEEMIPAPLPKPEPIGMPIVWADTRQELCEGVPYFRSYQGGIYFRSDLARGYLLDAFGAERDFIDLTSSYLMGIHVMENDLTMLEVVDLQLMPPRMFDLLRGVN